MIEWETKKEAKPMGDNDLKTTEAQRRASLKWEQDNNEKITVKFRRDGRDGFTKDQLRRRAERDGFPSLNAWMLEAIRDKL